MRRPATRLLLLALTATAALAAPRRLHAQASPASQTSQTYAATEPNFFDKWEDRATATQALQPKWMVPTISPYPMLIQVFRADFTRQISTTGVTTWNYGTSRGLNLIPFARTEVDILIPPFFEHDNATAKANQNGFGDFSFTGKYRIASANETHGNYMVSALLTTTIPTGAYKNGATNATLTPVLALGKGFGKFDVIECVSGALPTGNTATIGRTLANNATFQYHVQKYIWPEFEINTTAWYGGSKDGKVQTFLSPGLMFGKYAPYPKDAGPAKGRLGFAAGAAFQTVATTYRTYNHSLIFTGRILF
jgi:hypothetical protein